MADTVNRFFWYELMTPDPEAASRFYEDVIGWRVEDPAGTTGDYRHIHAGGVPVGGIMPLPAPEMPAAWTGYVHVEDVDDKVRRLTAAGGTVLRAAEDMENVGRFAVVADPGGAVFQLMAPVTREDDPAPPPPWEPGTIGWRELYSAAGEEAAFAFYESLLGWETITAMDMGEMGKYRIFGKGEEQMGGMMDKPPQMPRSAWLFYVCVEGIDAAAARIGEAGGQILMGPHEVPGGSWIVQAMDPQGAMFALVSNRR